MAGRILSGIRAAHARIRETVIPFEALCIAAIIVFCWVNAARFIV